MTCEIEVAADVWPSKHPSATEDYAADFEYECVRRWQPGEDCLLGHCIRYFGAGQASGYEFEVTTPGRTGGRHPSFLVNQPTIDGSVIWTPRAISNASVLRTISGTPIWAAEAGVTISAQAVSDFRGIAKISGGEDGQDYLVTVTALGSDGVQLVKTAVLPVRVPVRVC
jgi:hypothetical protein